MSQALERVLLIVSVPPPVTGQSLSSALLIDNLEREKVSYEIVRLGLRQLSGSLAFETAFKAVRTPLVWSAFARRARTFAPSVVYLQLGHSMASLCRDCPILFMANRMGLPVVAHVHGSGLSDALDNAPKALKGFFARQLSKLSLLISLSDSLVPVRPPLSRVPSVVVPNGVPRALAHIGHQTERSHEHQPIVALFLSHLFPMKGYQRVLEAAHICDELRLPVRFRLAGEVSPKLTKPHPAAYIAEKNLTNTEYLGPLYGEAKVRALRDADVLLLPSDYEGQPIVILEALHFGLIVIASEVGGIPDVIESGSNGFLLTKRDSSAIVSSLKGVLALEPHQRESISRRAQETAKARFSESVHSRSLVNYLTMIAKGRLDAAGPA